MKNWVIANSLLLALASGAVYANESMEMGIDELPTDEKSFVDTIGKLDKAKIVALLGEPAKADEVKLKDSGRVVASIWQYHFINTDANGTYYQTTELDFIEDKVNMVVFMNHDGSESESSEQQSYEIPDMMPSL